MAQQVKIGQIKEITFPMFRNYGSVLHDWIGVLLKPQIDAESSVEAKDDKFEGKFSITHR